MFQSIYHLSNSKTKATTTTTKITINSLEKQEAFELGFTREIIHALSVFQSLIPVAFSLGDCVFLQRQQHDIFGEKKKKSRVLDFILLFLPFAGEYSQRMQNLTDTILLDFYRKLCFGRSLVSSKLLNVRKMVNLTGSNGTSMHSYI